MTVYSKPEFIIDASRDRSTLLLPLDTQSVLSDGLRSQIETLGYKPKTEFHVTVFDDKPNSLLRFQLLSLSDSLRVAVNSLIRQATSGEEWGIELAGDYFAVNKNYRDEDEPRESIIQSVHSDAIEEWYRKLGIILGVEVHLPPAHITLATKGNARGIGITTEAELVELGKPISLNR